MMQHKDQRSRSKHSKHSTRFLTSRRAAPAGATDNCGHSDTGLLFPPERVALYMRAITNWDIPVSRGASVYATAVIEYMCTEVLFLAAQVAHERQRATISPRHIQRVVRSSKEMNMLLGSLCGMPPFSDVEGGSSALDVAVRKGRGRIAEHLRAAGPPPAGAAVSDVVPPHSDVGRG